MARPSLHIFLSVLVLALPIYAAGLGRKTGGWTPIKDPNDPEVVMVAKFAVGQHNKKTNTSLVFDTVVKGESQVVAGTNYRLDISAADTDVDTPKSYRALVYYKPWNQFLKLISFYEIKA